MEDKIIIKGAKENNLKNVSVEIPRNKLVVFSGVSGSGKSTLAFDTIFAEGQRRFLESLSSYARMFLGEAQKPNVESIEGLSPAISIDQKTTSQNPRSTVGTVTEIYDYIRVLFSNLGVPHCPRCGKEIKQQTVDDIIQDILTHKQGEKIIILAPIVRSEKGTQAKLFENLQRQGYVRVLVDDEMLRLDEKIELDKNKKHNISVVVDRVQLDLDVKTRLSSSVETAINLTNGIVTVQYLLNDEKVNYSTKYACEDCNISLEELSPRMFSFNSPFGACKKCLGIGEVQTISPKLLLKNQDLSINDGAISVSGWREFDSMSGMFFKALSERYGIDLNKPIKNLSNEKLNILLYGNNGEELQMSYQGKKMGGTYKSSFEGLIPNLERRYNSTNSEFIRKDIGRFIVSQKCRECNGTRLNQTIRAVTVEGKNITEVCDMSISNALVWFKNLTLKESQMIVAEPLKKEIIGRLSFLNDVGLGYLTLSRVSSTLSGGESQRIRLATQIGSGLVGVLYILDEPSIGLHQRDNDKLLATMVKLRDMGNSLIVVEHDEDTIRQADFIVDIGPYAGKNGGEIVAAGSAKDIMENPRSLTGQYLSGELKIETPNKRRDSKELLVVKKCSQNNLKNITAKFKIGCLNVVTGVSGSGKSSLVTEILYPALVNKLNRANVKEGSYEEITGLEYLDKVIQIDQTPIGRTPRSNPATYAGLFGDIREIFAQTNGAKERGYTASRFSFNVSGGRCEACEGDGVKKIEMYFLPDVFVPCDVCRGKRYNSETLEVKFKGKTIADVLEMTVAEALQFFENVPKIKKKLQTIDDVGLGYIKLGQNATTLSGGEAQRVKLATELSKASTGKTIYILDEPTTGLHSFDVSKLLAILDRLVSKGNTVVVIEHNLDVIKCADYIIDLGPEGGSGGGTIVTCGTPEQVACCENSFTGQYLKKILKNIN